VAQHGKGARKPGLRPHRAVKPWHRLHIMVEHLRRLGQDLVEVALPSPEIRGQHFESSLGSMGTHGPHGGRIVPGSPVGEIIAGHRGDHNVAET